ncbi:Phospholipase C/P1 nuclease domain containing protein [Tylopilus felleus]
MVSFLLKPRCPYTFVEHTVDASQERDGPAFHRTSTTSRLSESWRGRPRPPGGLGQGLHYINAVDDYPSAVCAFPGSNGWGGRTHINLLHGIRNTTAGLGWNTDDDDIPSWVKDALKFLIHFLGDMHQPLHLTGRNCGGNGDKVAFDGRTTNLHSVWDSLLISERLHTLPPNYTYPLSLPNVESYLRPIYPSYRLGRPPRQMERRTRRLAHLPAIPVPVGTPPWPSSTPILVRMANRLVSLLSRDDDECEDDESGLGVNDDHLCPYA